MDDFDIAPSTIGESAQRTKLERDDRAAVGTLARNRSGSQSAVTATLHITVKSRFGAGCEYDGPCAFVLTAWAIKQTAIVLVIWLAGSAAAAKILSLMP